MLVHGGLCQALERALEMDSLGLVRLVTRRTRAR